MHLQAGALLKNGEYKIEKVLGQGGFGITYLAEQTSLGRKVALKEFFMEGLCNRDADTSNVSVGSVGSKKLVERFKQKFIKEARMIASFDNNHIISIHDVFEENGTAYYVMEYLGGKSLSAIVNEQGIMSETLALKYIRQVADALAEVHANNLLHLDVKPANIMLNKKGEAVLIDFGISKHYDEAGNQTSSALIGTSEGYAPLEQYEAGALDSFTPATDIYALGATLFFLLTGTRPPKAGDVMNDGLPELPSEISQTVSGAITAAMQPRRKDRPQSIAEFLCLVESGKMQDKSDGETELNGNVKGASKREGENLFTHTASESSFDEVKGENGKLVADEFHSIDVVEVPDSEDGNVIFRGKPSTARLSVSEESQSSSPVISNESEKSQSDDAVILNASEKSQSANNEILPPYSRQNDKDGKEEVKRRNEKEHSAGAVISNGGEKSQKNKPRKSLWLILFLLLLIAVAGACFLFSGTGSGNTPKTDTKKQIVKKDTPTSPVGDEQEKPVEKGDSEQTPESIVPMCRVTLTQIPDGAEVYINDSLIGKTPIKNHEIPQGTYNIKITKDGYKDYEETFTLDGKERTISPTLEKSTTALYVTTTPSGAQVSIDNTSIGKTPIKGYEIPQGTHNITITKDGYKDYNEKIEASAGLCVINETLEENPKPVVQDNSFKTREFSVNGVSFKMVAVEGGTFQMGATSEQQNPYSNEKPVHSVTLSNYYIGETEVTQALWEAVMGSNPSCFKGSDNPVDCVSYNDCVAFVKKLNEKLKASGQLPAGREFRLPTEAEWEFAARGGNRSRGYQYSGSNTRSSVAWYYDNSNNTTHPVKQKQANELRLYDMSGNVREWCYDWYSNGYSSSSQTNPKGPSTGSLRVLRGGSWFNSAQPCRVANRNYSYPDSRDANSGLRLVL